MACKERGVSLLELLVVLLIFSLLAVFSVSSLQKSKSYVDLRSAYSQWRTSFYYAQKEAMRLQQTVYFCASEDGESCLPSKVADYKYGWIVLSESDDILLDVPTDWNLDVMQLSGNSKQLKFAPSGRLVGFVGSTLTIKNGEQNMSVVINRAGRMRIN